MLPGGLQPHELVERMISKPRPLMAGADKSNNFSSANSNLDSNSYLLHAGYAALVGGGAPPHLGMMAGLGSGAFHPSR